MKKTILILVILISVTINAQVGAMYSGSNKLSAQGATGADGADGTDILPLANTWTQQQTHNQALRLTSSSHSTAPNAIDIGRFGASVFGMYQDNSNTYLGINYSLITANRILQMPDENVDLGDIATNNAKVSFPEAPNDGTQYARKNNGWEAVTGGGSVDLTADLYVNNSTNASPRVGAEWVFSGNTYRGYMRGLNAALYIGGSFNGTTRDLLLSTSALRADVDDALDLGTSTVGFKRGYFSDQVYAVGFNTGGTGFLKANGTEDTNTYLQAPSVRQSASSLTMNANDINGSVNFSNGSNLTYTVQPNSSVACDLGTKILINNENASGTGVTITAGSGVTLNGGTAALALGQAAYILQVTVDEWIIINLN